MTPTTDSTQPGAAPAPRTFLVRHARYVAVVLATTLIGAVAFYPITHNSFPELLGETFLVSLILLGAYLLAGAWQQTWVPRWVAQVLAVAAAAPLGPLIVQLVSVQGDIGAFMDSRSRVVGFWWVTVSAALVRERDAQARAQALQFALERETLMRQATDARLNLLQAQIEPHFLLNTLANVQELIENGSSRAAPVFKSLIAYLRAAMPQLHQHGAALGHEADRVRSYLELMLMRMPDRLQFAVQLDPALRGLHFPAMALLTLVENAVHHGIDPCCDGGRIDVGARAEAAADGSTHLYVWVTDTGMGMSESAQPGIGLANLRARLQDFFHGRARLELSESPPQGVRAEIVVEGVD